jgi:hypothetical protein
LVTGLGSVDASNLANRWNTQAGGTSTDVTADPVEISWNSTLQFTFMVMVTATEGTGTPTGEVAFNIQDTSLGTAHLKGSAGVATATLIVNSSAFPLGASSVSALYSGDDSFDGSSASVAVHVSAPRGDEPVVAAITPDPVYEMNPDPDGNRWFFSIKVLEVAGVGATVTNFAIDDISYSSSIISFFGSNKIPPDGMLAAPLASGNIAVPSTHTFTLGGTTAKGQAWSQEISVAFYGSAPSR